MKRHKKLIEVSLPLDAINKASAREKSIRHGHPSTLHLWWARRPLAAARAVIFAQMVDDPSAYIDVLRGDAKLKRQAEARLKARRKLWDEARALADKAQGTSLNAPEPGPEPSLDEALADLERERLFAIIEDLVKWENTTNEAVLARARDEIWQSWRRACAENADHPQAAALFDRHKLPAFHDPFAGGGALPLEAQRLGLESHASDLNPVAVLINKAMIEIPPKFAGQAPVNPKSRADGASSGSWKGATGLAEDVRYYGQWMRDEAERRIGHLYPKVEVTAEMARDPSNPRPDLEPYVGKSLTVIAWLWARTVKSPNPAFADVEVPLASTFMLSTKKGKEAYVEPVILGARASGPQAGGTPALPGYRFTVKLGQPKDAEGARNGTKLSRGAHFKCLMSDTPIPSDHIYGEAQAGRMGARLMAIVAEGNRGRVYLAPTPEHEAAAHKAQPDWKPTVAMPENPRWFSPPLYGLTTYGDLFTDRQLVALTTFSDLVTEAREQVKRDFLGARASRPQKTWHSRGYLPHWEAGETPQSISFRLHDSLPQALLERWRDELASLPETQRALERRKRIEAALDAGHGACWLRDPRIAELVEQALRHFDGERYRLHAWCVMPNHVHVLVTPMHGYSLSSILHSWKSYTAKEANRILERSGAFWMEEYFDRAIRDDTHFNKVVEYIAYNPVQAGLCARVEDWRFGSGFDAHEERAGRPRSQDAMPLADGGTGATAYAEAVGVYLGMCVSRQTNRSATLNFWDMKGEKVQQVFGRQALPMTWDFVEGNPLSNSTGNFVGQAAYLTKVLAETVPAKPKGVVTQGDAQNQAISTIKVISCDPPYYDNIGYADLSDFFYVWLRRTLRPVFPELFATMAVPKAEELVATPYRHGNKEKAEHFFLNGMTQAMHRLAEQAHPAYPVTIYYAFKQSETLGARASGPHAVGTTALPGITNTGWDTFLAAIIKAGFAISGTWPMRTEYTGNLKKTTNALASSIVLVCRPRPADIANATRREFLNALKSELPDALAKLQAANIAPVDLAQAAIGPGMAVFTRYAQVLDAEGKPLSVRAALALINQVLDEVLAEQEGDFDPDSRFALAWFEQHGFTEGEFGVADVLARAKGTAVDGVRDAGIIASGKGRVRILKPSELPADWEPASDKRLTVWEMVHQLIRVLEAGGETAAADLAAKLGAQAETARELCYRLYAVCERKGRANDAMAYNGLVQSWPEISRLALERASQGLRQGDLALED